MPRSKCSRELYCSFLEVTSDRYSALSLNEVAPDVAALSHDSISRWLAHARVQPKDLWQVARKEVFTPGGELTPGILVFDDVVIDKSRSGKTELVNWQYSGAKHDITKGIGVVNALWQVNKEQYIPMDYRIWNPPEDGKTKNDHFQDMLAAAKQRQLSPGMVVADSWYSSLKNLKAVRTHGWDWVMGLRSNRLVNKPHVHIKTLEIPDEGLVVHLKGYGWIKLFRFVTTHGRTDYIGTSKLDLSREQVKAYFERRWSIKMCTASATNLWLHPLSGQHWPSPEKPHWPLFAYLGARTHKRRRRDQANNSPTSMYQQKWEVIKPSIQLALAARLRG